MEDLATTGPPEGSASLSGIGAGRGVRVVLSRKKQREAPESNVKVCRASAGAVPGGVPDSLAPRAVAAIPGTPGVVKAGKAAALSVILPACLARTDTRANDIQAGLTTLTHPTLNQPFTELLGRLGLAPTLLVLAPTTTRACAPRPRPTTTGPTASTAATPSAAATAVTRAATAATSPTTTTTTTTTTASTSSTAAPTTTPAATSTTTVASSTTPATLALTVAELRTSQSSTNVLKNRDVCSSSRGEGGGKGGGGAPLKEG
ncbi:unnamed protein product [Closterium sp. NIES-54]